jgi:hypothetical protein
VSRNPRTDERVRRERHGLQLSLPVHVK